jgi:predicted RNA-binding Zn-ribbon protein involved in translation (DUF1610 family)
MLIKCANCGGHFTKDELQRLRPPAHPWALTANGERTHAANTARGTNYPCPRCGQNTLGTVTATSNMA